MTPGPAHTLVDWLYNNPSWLVGLAIVGVTVAFSLIGLLLVHRLVDRALRQEHNDITGATSAIIGMVAAVLLAFISVATWETLARDRDIADAESTAITNLYFESFNIGSDALRVSVQDHIRRYARTVIEREWPAQQAGRFVVAARIPGRDELLAINREMAVMNPRTIGEGNVQSRLLTSLDQLFTDRRERVMAAGGHVNGEVWAVILLGTALAIAYTWLFGPRSLRMHMVMTGSVAASLSLVIVLIVVTDYPFRGSVGIGPDSYKSALQVMQVAAPPR